ncbi:hypothetical protein O1611_g1513 [Lasiodiplodia mahajangana]|uniref:Uncharacterized protein n=1 Tax=Lasiodiplodia mahajangana TaxID=1108764 RepID=A0ACC2JX74_9PEZI|nr:hypothetical protein O1611_g1513 [Lasiodiplodia mahajangana]
MGQGGQGVGQEVQYPLEQVDTGSLGKPASMSREEDLRRASGLPGKVFFVAAEDEGEVFCSSIPLNSSQLNYQRFFDQKAFVAEISRAKEETGQLLDQSFCSEMDTSGLARTRTSMRSRRRYQAIQGDGYDNDEDHRPRKRQRTISSGHGIDHGTLSAGPQTWIRISDQFAVNGLYDRCFKAFQQTVCKTLAKAWIKAIAPKKQSTNPYTRGDASRPDWWPAYYCKHGDTEWKPMRHKEPDHIGREGKCYGHLRIRPSAKFSRERVFLLCHLLRLSVEPEAVRDETFLKNGVDVGRLYKVTKETVPSWFNDRDKSPATKKKRAIVNDLFKVARVAASLWDKRCDANTSVLVSDGVPDYDEDEDEDDNDNNDIDEDLDHGLTPAASGASSVEPAGSQMIPPIHANELLSHSFPPPIRSAQYSYATPDPYIQARFREEPSLVTNASNYDSRNGHLGPQGTYPSPEATSRRSSVLTPTSEYDSNAAAPAVYPQWPTSHTPSNPPMYNSYPPPTMPPFSGRMAQGPPYSPSMDGLPPQAVDAHHPGLYNVPRIEQGAMQHPSAYGGYVDEGSIAGSLHVKTEATHNHPIGH